MERDAVRTFCVRGDWNRRVEYVGVVAASNVDVVDGLRMHLPARVAPDSHVASVGLCGRGVLVLFAGLLRHLAHAFRGTNQAILQQAHCGMLLGCWHLPRHRLLAEVRLLSSPTSLPALRGVFALRQGDVGRERRVPSNFHLDAARPRRAVEQNQHGPRFLGMHSRGCVLSDLCKYHKAN